MPYNNIENQHGNNKFKYSKNNISIMPIPIDQLEEIKREDIDWEELYNELDRCKEIFRPLYDMLKEIFEEE